MTAPVAAVGMLSAALATRLGSDVRRGLITAVAGGLRSPAGDLDPVPDEDRSHVSPRLAHARRRGCPCMITPRCNQYDLGRPSTCSAKKLRIKFVEIGAT
jgi:hypothetical protein